jgi:hypothetical protein
LNSAFESIGSGLPVTLQSLPREPYSGRNSEGVALPTTAGCVAGSVAEAAILKTNTVTTVGRKQPATLFMCILSGQVRKGYHD